MTKITIERDDGTVLIAEGRAVQNVTMERSYEIAPVPALDGKVTHQHTGFETFLVTVTAVCHYFREHPDQRLIGKDQNRNGTEDV